MNIQTELTRITNAKAAVKAAIEGKGVTVPEGTLIDGMAPLIESIEAGGGGVQPDWNQNDETAPDYVKNRPFYTGNPVETVLVEESTVSFTADSDGLYRAEFPSTFEATVGEIYKVSWDGAAYECACVNFSGMPVIGNLSILRAGSDTGEPFVMGILNGEAINIVTADTSASHTFSISGFASEVVKIEEKYLPEHKYISYEEQELTDSQKEIARNNINAVDNSIFIEISTNVISASEFDIYYEKYKKTGLPIKWEGAIINHIFHRDTIEEMKTYELVSGKQLFSMTEYIYNGQKKVSHGSWKVEPKYTYAYQISMTNPYNSSIRKTLELNDGGKIVTNDGYEIMMWNGGVVVNSSTPNSTKKFKITVDDNGVPTITDESDSTNTWKPTNLPTVTTSDAGKFLRVSDTGEWVAEIREIPGMTVEVTTLAAGAQATAELVESGDHIVLRLGIPKGQDGSATDTVVTASASAWSNNTITLSVTGVMADSKLEIGLSNTATDEQFTVAAAAQIRATSSGDGTVTLKAVAAPSVDLPILIRRLS